MSVQPKMQAQPMQPRAEFVLTRRSLALLLGAVTGVIWLLPVFGPPGGSLSQTGDNSVFRYLRLIAPLCVLLLIRRREGADLLNALLIKMPQGRLPRATLRLLGAVLVMGLIPLLSGLLTANVTFIVSAVLPLTFSLIALIGITLMDGMTLKSWVLGVAGVGTLFLVTGIITSHLEMTTYFGRPRALMGFVHPINTASAILSAMLFGPLAAGERVRRMRPVWFWMTLAGYALIFIALLLIAQSRNVLLSLCLGLACIWIAQRTRPATRFALFSLLLLAPLFLYSFVLMGSRDNPLWALVDDLASGRLSFFQAVLSSSLDLSDGRVLFAASGVRLATLSDNIGFAATDSVFLSFLVNYGLLATGAFVGMLLLVGGWLARNNQGSGPFGALCGIVFFFSLDAQGVTTSNLIIFILFAYAMRAGIRGERAGG